MRRAKITAAMAGLFFAGGAQAMTVHTVDSQQAWKQGVVEFSTEDFNSLPDEPVPVGGGTLTGPNGFDIVVDRESDRIATGILGGRFFGEVNSPTDLNGDPQTDVPLVTTLKFDGSILGFSATLLNVNTGGLQIMIGDQSFEVSDGTSFFGVLADLPGGFDELQIKYNPASTNRALIEQFFLDDVNIATALVPEPITAGLSLMSLGALAVAATRRRRQA